MNYDIKIRGDAPDNGTIEFDKIASIAKSTKDIVQKALMLRLFGYSDVKLPEYLKNALKIRLEAVSGNQADGTSLLIGADKLEGKLGNIQPDIFRPDLLNELQELTPMTLLIGTFRSALVQGEETNNLDKPLLKSLLQFRKNFSSDNEVFYFSNRQSIPSIEVKLRDFKKIELLDDTIPEPIRVVVSGSLDEMKFSKGRLVLVTEEGPVNVITRDNTLIAEMSNFFGKECTVQGMAHYRPGGMLSYVEMQRFAAPNAEDKYFSRVPSIMDAGQQLKLQLTRGRRKNLLSSLLGQWPGDENDAEFEQILSDIDQ